MKYGRALTTKDNYDLTYVPAHLRILYADGSLAGNTEIDNCEVDENDVRKAK